jgi:DNA-binding CsgD family transcriptional regulator
MSNQRLVGEGAELVRPVPHHRCLAQSGPVPFLRPRSLERLAQVTPNPWSPTIGPTRNPASLSRDCTSAAFVRVPPRVVPSGPSFGPASLARIRGPPGRPARPRALTARGREVATLAARWLSTNEIAARLHLSTRTIESDLERAYRKLGIDGRSMLAQAHGVGGGG